MEPFKGDIGGSSAGTFPSVSLTSVDVGAGSFAAARKYREILAGCFRGSLGDEGSGEVFCDDVGENMFSGMLTLP